MTPGYVHHSRRGEAQSVAQLEASIKKKNRLLVKTNQDRAEVQGKLELAEERIKTLAKANAKLVAEIQELKAKAQDSEQAPTPAPVEPVQDDNQLLIDALKSDNKRLREEKSEQAEQIKTLRMEKLTLKDRLIKTQQAAKANRETTGAVTAQMEQIITAIVPGQVVTISQDGDVTTHQRDTDPVRIAQTLRQAAEAITAHALTEELA